MTKLKRWEWRTWRYRRVWDETTGGEEVAIDDRLEPEILDDGFATSEEELAEEPADEPGEPHHETQVFDSSAFEMLPEETSNLLTVLLGYTSDSAHVPPVVRRLVNTADDRAKQTLFAAMCAPSFDVRVGVAAALSSFGESVAGELLQKNTISRSKGS